MGTPGQAGGTDGRDRTIVAVLQFLVGALLILGGGAFAAFALTPLGTGLGLVHLLVGLLGLGAGVVLVRRRDLPSRLLLAANGITIGYSAFSETLVEVESLLPDSAARDSLVGTVAAISMSLAIVYILLRRRSAGHLQSNAS